MKKTTTFLVSLFVLLNYQNIKATNVATTPITDANIRTAVNAWVTNRSTAYTTYGHIKEWDVSNVTDMSQLFDNAQDFNDDISDDPVFIDDYLTGGDDTFSTTCFGTVASSCDSSKCSFCACTDTNQNACEETDYNG